MPKTKAKPVIKKKPVGRSSKLTPEIHHKIVNLIKLGNYNETAAEAVGIDVGTFYNWMKKGEAGIKPEYVKFFNAIKEAASFSEAHYLSLIHKAASDATWQAAAWFLERKYNERWGRRDKHEHSGPDGGPIVIGTGYPE